MGPVDPAPTMAPDADPSIVVDPPIATGPERIGESDSVGRGPLMGEVTRRIERRPVRLAFAVAPLVLALFVFGALIRTGGGLSRDPVFVTPRESVSWAIADSWAETGRPSIVEPRLSTLPNDLGPALTPRDGASAGDEYLAKDFPLTIAAYAAALKLSDVLAMALNPLQAALLVLSVAWLAHEVVGDRRAAAVAPALLIGTYSFWSSSSSPVATDTLGAALIVAAAASLYRAEQVGHHRWAVAAGLGVAAAAASRYTLIGPGLAVIGIFWLRGRVSTAKTTGAVLAVIAGLLPLLIFHDRVYGGVTATGYGLGDQLFISRVGLTGGSLLSFDAGRLANHLWFYFLRPETLLLLSLGAYGAYVTRRDARPQVLTLSAVVISVALVGYHGGQGTWGSGEFVINASILRYVLVMMAMVCVLASSAVIKLSGDRLTAMLAVLALSISAVIWNVWTGPAGLLSADRQIDRQRIAQTHIETNTPADAIIITRLGSKTVFPDRAAMTATLMLTGEEREIGDDEVVWDLVPTVEELAGAIAALHRDGNPVYIYNDGGGEPWLDFAAIQSLESDLLVYGLSLTDLSFENIDLFAVSS